MKNETNMGYLHPVKHSSKLCTKGFYNSTSLIIKAANFNNVIKVLLEKINIFILLLLQLCKLSKWEITFMLVHYVTRLSFQNCARCCITLLVCHHLKDDNNTIKQKTIRLSILLWFNTKQTFGVFFFQKLINLFTIIDSINWKDS